MASDLARSCEISNHANVTASGLMLDYAVNASSVPLRLNSWLCRSSQVRNRLSRLSRSRATCALVTLPLRPKRNASSSKAELRLFSSFIFSHIISAERGPRGSEGRSVGVGST